MSSPNPDFERRGLPIPEAGIYSGFFSEPASSRRLTGSTGSHDEYMQLQDTDRGGQFLVYLCVVMQGTNTFGMCQSKLQTRVRRRLCPSREIGHCKSEQSVTALSLPFLRAGIDDATQEARSPTHSWATLSLSFSALLLRRHCHLRSRK